MTVIIHFEGRQLRIDEIDKITHKEGITKLYRGNTVIRVITYMVRLEVI